MVEPVKRSKLRTLWDLLMCVAAGLGMWASFPDLSWWWLLIPSLTVFFSRIDHVSGRRGALYSFVFAMIFWLPLIDWVPMATGGWLPWAALAISQAAFYVAWTLIVRLARVWRWTTGPIGQPLTYALTWVGVEQLRSSFPWSGFPWGNVALPQVDSPIGHLAPYGGEVLVSFVVVVAAVLVRRAFCLVPGTGDASWWERPAALGLALVIMVAPMTIPLSSEQEEGALKVAVIQGDVELPGAVAFSHEGEVTANNAEVTAEFAASGEDVDLVIWGETGADRDPRESQLVASLVSTASKRVGTPLLFGFGNVRDDLRWNWIGVWYPGSGLDESSLYAKQKPVPFGEFIPWRDVVSRLATEAAQINLDMAAADNPGYMEATTVDGRIVPMSVGICFESAYESVISEGVLRGGQIIVTPSNNYHFQTSPESAQQGQALRFRALEYSRSAIQASTTGSSYIIRPNGQIQTMTDPQTADYLVGEVPLRTTITPAARMGEWPSTIVIRATGILIVFALITAILSQRRRTTRR